MSLTKEELKAEVVELQKLKDRYVEFMRSYTECHNVTVSIFERAKSEIGQIPPMEQAKKEYMEFMEQFEKDMAILDKAILILDQ